MEDSLQLNLEILAEQGIALIRCRGKLKFGKESQVLKECVDSMLSQFSICVLSLTAIQQIDARGLGALVACVEKGGSLGCLLLIGGASAVVRDLLRITKLNPLREVYSSEFFVRPACRQVGCTQGK